MGVRLRTPFLLPASHDRARFVHSFLPPRFPRTRSRANARPAWRSAARRREARPSRRLAPARRTRARRRATRDEKGADENPGEDEKGADEKGLTLSPGPGAYDAAAAFAATRPSAASAPPFAPRSRPAEIRVAKRRDKVHTADEVPLDLSAERWRVAAGSPRAERLPVRVVRARAAACHGGRGAVPRALARNAEPTSSEQTSRRGALGAPSPRTSSAMRASWTRSRASSRPGRSSRLPSRAGRVSRRVSNERPYSSSRRCLFPTRAHAGFDARRETEDELADPLAAARRGGARRETRALLRQAVRETGCARGGRAGPPGAGARSVARARRGGCGGAGARSAAAARSPCATTSAATRTTRLG